jgi:hypothetical protein
VLVGVARVTSEWVECSPVHDPGIAQVVGADDADAGLVEEALAALQPPAVEVEVVGGEEQQRLGRGVVAEVDLAGVVTGVGWLVEDDEVGAGASMASCSTVSSGEQMNSGRASASERRATRGAVRRGAAG